MQKDYKSISIHQKKSTPSTRIIFAILLAIIVVSFSILHKDTIYANDTDFSNGITVDSTLDTPDSNIADTICDDGDGNCTLRAAIQEANSNPDLSTINFNISGTPDFANAGEDGYRIILGQELPKITAPTYINGYTQPGAEVNTAIAPNPINALLLIEIDGSGIDDSNNYLPEGIVFWDGSDNSSIRGLVINDFTEGRAIQSFKNSGLQVQGNFIGTSPDGMSAEPNSIGLNGCACDEDNGINVLVGGLDPEDRNIISGNSTGGGPAAGYPAHGWVIQGNYVGLGADGITAIPNAKTDGSGAFSIDFADDVLIGGTDPAAINVISGNNNFGMAPHMADGLIVQGNYIGTDYTGMVSVPNNGPGIGISESSNVLIGGSTTAARNVIASNVQEGISFGQSDNFTVQGNYIGVLVDGVTAAPNGDSGVGTLDSSGIIGGATAGAGNIVANSQSYEQPGYGVDIAETTEGDFDVAVLGNSIYNNQELGIALNGALRLNDPLDSDTGSNDLLNFPLYTNIQEESGDTTIDYLLDVPAGDYRIEFFSNTTPDSSGYGEGEEYLGFANVTSTGSGAQSFSYTLSGVTGVTNLALTTTEIDNSTNGFGATSEFGGAVPPVSDISITKTLTNPQDIALGATANYQLTYTNNGPDVADLSMYSGRPFLVDFVPPDLINPSGYISDGPEEGTIFIDVGNPNVACIYGPAPLASAFGFTSDLSIGIVVCELSGPETTLNAGQSITFGLNFEVAPDSDLEFTNYALAMSASDDPDINRLEALFGSTDLLADLIAGQDPLNNFAASAFPVPLDPEESTSTPQSSSSTALGSTGQSVSLLIILICSLVSLSFYLLIYTKSNSTS